MSESSASNTGGNSGNTGQQQQQQQQTPAVNYIANRPSSLFSLLRLAQPNFREFLINSNLFAENPNDFNDMITQSLLNNNFNRGETTPNNNIITAITPGSGGIVYTQIPQNPSEGILGESTFFSGHSRYVKGVDFSPKEDHLFCSTGLDGKLIVYDARFAKIKSTTPINYLGSISFSGLKFLPDGYRVALTTTSNKLLIYDIEKGISIQSIDKCCSSINPKTSIAIDPVTGLIMTPNLTGNGISQIDTRTSSIVKSLDHIHSHQINDIQLLDQYWSDTYKNIYRNNGGITSNNTGSLIMTGSSDTTCKIFDSQKNIIKDLQTRSPIFSIATVDSEYPTTFNNTGDLDNSTGCLALGGDKLNFYSMAGSLEQPTIFKGIIKLRYTRSGSRLFTAGNDGYVRMFSRNKRKHEVQGVVYTHSREIQDMVISRNDEYLVTASTDSKVGLIRIGDPIFGQTEFGNII